MKNSEMPINPLAGKLLHDLELKWIEKNQVAIGLTKREEFARSAMIALASNPEILKRHVISNQWSDTIDTICHRAVQMADKLLLELEK